MATSQASIRDHCQRSTKILILMSLITFIAFGFMFQCSHLFASFIVRFCPLQSPLDTLISRGDGLQPKTIETE